MYDKLAVMGAGAIGSNIGAYLTRAGRDITLIDMWPAHVEQMKKAGLKLTAEEAGEFTVPVKAVHLGEVAGMRVKYDAIFLSVKSYDTQWACKFIEPLLKPEGIVISAQNSINEELITPVLGFTRVLGAVVTLGSGLYEPGHVIRTSLPQRRAFAVGELNGMATPRAAEIANILSAVGPTKVTTNLWGERWAKLAVNSMANALAGITLMNNAEMRQSNDVFNITVKVGAEAATVAAALGVQVEPIGGIPASEYIDAARGKGLEELRNKWVENGRQVGAGRPSLSQDVIKGRRTEIEYLNGLVARKGREAGIPTPMNAAIVDVCKKVESGELKPSAANLKLLTPYV